MANRSSTFLRPLPNGPKGLPSVTSSAALNNPRYPLWSPLRIAASALWLASMALSRVGVFIGKSPWVRASRYNAAVSGARSASAPLRSYGPLVHHAGCPTASSLDHLVSPCQYRGGDCQADGLRCFQVDYQLKLCGLLDWEVPGMCAFENLVDVHGRLPKQLRDIRRV